MRKTYGLLFLSLLLLLISPAIFLKKIQLKWVDSFKSLTFKEEAFDETSLEKVKLDNYILKSQIAYIQEWIAAHQKFEDFFSELKKLDKTQHLAVITQDAQKKRLKILQDFLNLFGRYAFAKIIFKEPFSSSSYAWINLGEGYNKKIGNNLIQKNSPVVYGDHLLGIVEEVFPNHSKIRLITDPNLVVSVRSSRGDQQLKIVNAKASDLLDSLELIQELSWAKKEGLKELLIELTKDLEKDGHDRFYAKGEVFGAEYSPFLAFQNALIGEGFYLQTAQKSLQQSANIDGFKEIAIKQGDLLVTTGLDGLFPKGLKVGIVLKVEPSQLGQLAYKINAKSTLPDMNEIEYVQVLPPILEPSAL